MNYEFQDFIGVFRDVFPKGYCQHLIDQFDLLEKNGVGSNRQQSERALRHTKDDHHIFLNLKNHSIDPFDGRNAVDIFFNGLQACYDAYTDKYSVLKNSGNIRGSAMKMQRTKDGGGYHVWHAEQGGAEQANRVLVYMLYLNTLPEGGNGETEFLYQQRRINPEENVMLMWPAAYTHAHRGNPVYGQTAKYIVTGWFYYD